MGDLFCKGERPARVEWAGGSVIAVGVDRGVVLDPVEARFFFLVGARYLMVPRLVY